MRTDEELRQELMNQIIPTKTRYGNKFTYYQKTNPYFWEIWKSADKPSYLGVRKSSYMDDTGKYPYVFSVWGNSKDEVFSRVVKLHAEMRKLRLTHRQSIKQPIAA